MRRLLSAAALLAPARARARLLRRPDRAVDARRDRPARRRDRLRAADRRARRAVRRAHAAAAPRRRSGARKRRRSLAFFAQLTDPQIVDEMSPARVDFVDPAGGALKSSHRPQEALGAAGVRRDRAQRQREPAQPRSATAAAGARGSASRSPPATSPTTSSSTRRAGSGPCSTAAASTRSRASRSPPATRAPRAPDVIARLNDDVANRRYTGVQDYDDWRGAPTDLYGGYWDPDEAAPTGGPYAAFPRYPGPDGRARRRRSTPTGLDVPWYISRGNHDGLHPGQRAREHRPVPLDRGRLPEGLPDAGGRPRAVRRAPTRARCSERFNDPAFIASLLAGGRAVPPDPDRRIINKAEYRDVMARATGRARLRRDDASASCARSKGTASYYASRRARGLRFISLDTVAEGGGAERQPRRPAVPLAQARAAQGAPARPSSSSCSATTRSATMTQHAPPTRPPARASPPDEPGCDTDPRRSTPLHRGLDGAKTRALRCSRATPQRDRLRRRPHARQRRSASSAGGAARGFWEINTASHIDWPQQSRLIEVMDNRDGTLSIFGTILDSAAPAAAPAPGDAIGAVARGSSSRSAATLVLQRPAARAACRRRARRATSSARRRDRNVELLVRDPR